MPHQWGPSTHRDSSSPWELVVGLQTTSVDSALLCILSLSLTLSLPLSVLCLPLLFISLSLSVS